MRVVSFFNILSLPVLPHAFLFLHCSVPLMKYSPSQTAPEWVFSQGAWHTYLLWCRVLCSQSPILSPPSALSFVYEQFQSQKKKGTGPIHNPWLVSSVHRSHPLRGTQPHSLTDCLGWGLIYCLFLRTPGAGA